MMDKSLSHQAVGQRQSGRAASPLDALDFLGDPTPLPLPPLPVGTRVEFNSAGMHPSDLAYFQRQALKYLVRTSRRIVRRLRKQGFMGGESLNGRLGEHNRGKIREIFEVMKLSHTMEIAGWQPQGMHVLGCVANQCYLASGSCHSGVSYRAYLLFRVRLYERELVYIHPEALVNAAALRAVPVPVQQVA